MQLWTILYPIVNSSLSKTNFTQTDWSSFYNTEALYTDFTTVLRTATGRAHWPATSGPKGQAVSGLAGDIAGEGGLSVRAHRPAHRAEHRSHWARMGGGRGVVGAVFCCLSNKTTWVAETTAVEVRRNDTKSRSNYAVYPGNSRSNCAVFQGNSRSNCVARQQQIKLLCSKATAELLCSMARTYQTAVFQGNSRPNCGVPRQQQIKLLCSKATADSCMELICSAENTTKRIWQRRVRNRIHTCWRRWAGTWDLVSFECTSQGWWSYHCLHSTCNPVSMLTSTLVQNTTAKLIIRKTGCANALYPWKENSVCK